MPGEYTALKAALLAGFNAQINSTTAQPTPITQLSDAQATAIINAIKTAIDTTLVLPVLVAPNGPVTGTITLKNQIT